jgi:hypothetical protein
MFRLVRLLVIRPTYRGICRLPAVSHVPNPVPTSGPRGQGGAPQAERIVVGDHDRDPANLLVTFIGVRKVNSLGRVTPLHRHLLTVLPARKQAAGAGIFRFHHPPWRSRSIGEEGRHLGKGLQRGKVRLGWQLRSVAQPIDHAEEAKRLAPRGSKLVPSPGRNRDEIEGC